MPKKKQQQKFPFYKKFLNEIIVGLITLVSLGSIIFLYFSYEDFNTFYLFQDSKEAAAMLKIPEFARHLGTYYLVEPFYKVFGYNPVGYYIFILICAVITSILFYRFLVVLTKQKTLSFLSSIIFASSYYGVEAYYWNMTSGFETALSSAILFIVLLFLLEYLQNKKKLYLIFAIFVYPIFAFLFKAKAFIAILEIFILFALFVDKKTVKQKILSLSPFVLFTGFIFWSNLTGGGN
ncbi:MAG TPA: glycosyltransferase family 39 protein, partial [Patescibacteria group bacterium]